MHPKTPCIRICTDLNIACRSFAGFQLVSNRTTLFAATRLMPMFPAFVESRNTLGTSLILNI